MAVSGKPLGPGAVAKYRTEILYFCEDWLDNEAASQQEAREIARQHALSHLGDGLIRTPLIEHDIGKIRVVGDWRGWTHDDGTARFHQQINGGLCWLAEWTIAPRWWFRLPHLLRQLTKRMFLKRAEGIWVNVKLLGRVGAHCSFYAAWNSDGSAPTLEQAQAAAAALARIKMFPVRPDPAGDTVIASHRPWPIREIALVIAAIIFYLLVSQPVLGVRFGVSAFETVIGLVLEALAAFGLGSPQ